MPVSAVPLSYTNTHTQRQRERERKREREKERERETKTYTPNRYIIMVLSLGREHNDCLDHLYLTFKRQAVLQIH